MVAIFLFKIPIKHKLSERVYLTDNNLQLLGDSGQYRLQNLRSSTVLTH